MVVRIKKRTIMEKVIYALPVVVAVLAVVAVYWEFLLLLALFCGLIGAIFIEMGIKKIQDLLKCQNSKS